MGAVGRCLGEVGAAGHFVGSSGFLLKAASERRVPEWGRSRADPLCASEVELRRSFTPVTRRHYTVFGKPGWLVRSSALSPVLYKRTVNPSGS